MAKEKNPLAEVDWAGYFLSIQEECPWSLRAYYSGKIDLVTWMGDVYPLDSFMARVYAIDLGPIKLSRLTRQLNERHTESEWLYSHPRYKKFSTPIPVLIQQDRRLLAKIREKLSRADK